MVKPCKRCGAKDRYSSGNCRPCSLVSSKKWTIKNKERVRRYEQEYCAANKARIKERKRKYHAENRKRENKRKRKYHAENREKENERSRKWYLSNPEKKVTSRHAYRARKKENGGKLTVTDIKFVRAAFPVCLHCGIDENLSIDHVIPLARGGTNSIDNIQILCMPCNSSKGIKTIDYRPSYE